MGYRVLGSALDMVSALLQLGQTRGRGVSKRVISWSLLLDELGLEIEMETAHTNQHFGSLDVGSVVVNPRITPQKQSLVQEK
jgi:hypothetical protein